MGNLLGRVERLEGRRGDAADGVLAEALKAVDTIYLRYLGPESKPEITAASARKKIEAAIAKLPATYQKALARNEARWAKSAAQLMPTADLFRIAKERAQQSAAAHAAWEASQQAKLARQSESAEPAEGAPARWVPAMPQRTQQRVTLEAGHLVTRPVKTRDPLADYREPNLTEDELVARLNDTLI